MSWIRTRPALATLAVALLFCGAAVAGAGIIVSNHLTSSDHVEDEGVTLSWNTTDGSDTDGEDRTDYVADETKYKGTEYDLAVDLEASSDYTVQGQFAIYKDTGINETDLTIEYWDATGEEWVDLTPTAEENYLNGSFGPEDGFDVTDGYSETSYFLVTYENAGDYEVDIWTESL